MIGYLRDLNCLETVIQKYVTLFGLEVQQFTATGQTENVHALLKLRMPRPVDKAFSIHNAPQGLKLFHVLIRTQGAHCFLNINRIPLSWVQAIQKQDFRPA